MLPSKNRLPKANMLNKSKLFAKNDSTKSMYIGRKSSEMLDFKKLQVP